jgi:GNAT superfamily N-acetyltransferase
MTRPRKSSLTFGPVTEERWPDLEHLFGPRGACAGCWCMWWRLTHSEFDRKKGPGNRRALRQLVRSGTVPGILAYVDGEVAGWCSVGPRADFSRLARSRVLKPVDDQPVWSVVCFFVAKPHRKKGLTVELLKAAARYARQRGARVLEGYPVEPRAGRMPDVFAYTGLPSAYEKAGFLEVARRSETRPIMRRRL